MAPADPDLALRQAAVAHARRLAQDYDDLVPLARLRQGFEFAGRRVGFGSFVKGIHRDRAQRGPAALTLVTSSKDPYADTFDEAGARFAYAYRAGAIDRPDNRALRAAFSLQTPLVYFRAPGGTVQALRVGRGVKRPSQASGHLRRLDRVRNREGRSRSELIREAVEQYLAADAEAEIDRLVDAARSMRSRSMS